MTLWYRSLRLPQLVHLLWTREKSNLCQKTNIWLLTPTVTNLSYCASTSIWSVSFWILPLFTRISIARETMSYTSLVASNFLSILGADSQGSGMVVGVVLLSNISYRFLSCATSAGSSAISWLVILRTVVWKTSCREQIGKPSIAGNTTLSPRNILHIFFQRDQMFHSFPKCPWPGSNRPEWVQ